MGFESGRSVYGPKLPSSNRLMSAVEMRLANVRRIGKLCLCPEADVPVGFLAIGFAPYLDRS
jgi:hypothetical protein